MAMLFYVVQAYESGFELQRVALLLGTQTAGALASNALWGWWGDRLGKSSLLKAIAIGRVFPPGAVILLTFTGFSNDAQMLYIFIAIFFILGALANGLTIAVIGFLMEISPDDLRPAYSGYFNAITAPAFLLPFLAGILATIFDIYIVFIISMIAAVVQTYILILVRRQSIR